MLEIKVDLEAQGGYRGLGDAITFSWLAETAKQQDKTFRFFTDNPAKIKLLSLFNQNRLDNRDDTISTAFHYQQELDRLGRPSRLDILKELLGVTDCANVRPGQQISPKSLQWADQTYLKISQDKYKFVMLFPGANFSSRQYPANYWCCLAWELFGKGIPCAVFDTAYSEMLEKFPLWFYGVEMEDLAALVKRADLVVGNDSFPAHLSGTLGTPALVLLGPTNPQVYRYLPDVRTLSSDRIDCSGCHFGPPFRSVCDLGCLSLYRLFPEEVLGAIFDILKPPLFDNDAKEYLRPQSNEKNTASNNSK
ncbi:MAG: hypothetical protein HY892_13195 [Deltaproteobacteria bacterium]|nr:hypothetical protein [Deltaproteobacteria bacterium]